METVREFVTRQIQQCRALDDAINVELCSNDAETLVQRIAELERQLKESAGYGASWRSTAENIRAQLDARELKIAGLQDEVARLKARIAKLME